MDIAWKEQICHLLQHALWLPRREVNIGEGEQLLVPGIYFWAQPYFRHQPQASNILGSLLPVSGLG